MGIARSKSGVVHSDSENPFLPPGKDAPAVVWRTFFPLHQLPPLPARGDGYWSEPWCGIIFVGFLCFVFISTTTNMASSQPDESYTKIYVSLIWLWAGIATFSTTYLICGGAGEIVRSESNCYPIPGEVLKRLQMKEQNLPAMQNITEGKSNYCVRCFLWRSEQSDGSRPHHCNTCQRCYVGFDHHCAVFGRCIVKANMPCFAMNFVMLFAAILTTGCALVTSTPYHRERVHPPTYYDYYTYRTKPQGEDSAVTLMLENSTRVSYVLP